MQELYNKFKKYNLDDAIRFEEEDRQFLALKDLWDFWKLDKNTYLSFIIANSIICYQLSWKWEDYWEELSKKLQNRDRNIYILNFFKDFLPTSKNNKRFIATKLKRLEKLMSFLEEFVWKEAFYYENMTKLRDDLAKIMKQKKDAKTIVFAVKMFSYWARNCFSKLVKFPDDIVVPVDSRLTKIFEKYKGEYTDINKFYFGLSKKLKIPELHLDAILWNSNDLI